MHAFAVFKGKYLRLYGCSGTNFMAIVTWKNPKTEIEVGIIETQIIEIEIYFELKNILPCQWQTCLFAINCLALEFHK